METRRRVKIRFLTFKGQRAVGCKCDKFQDKRLGAACPLEQIPILSASCRWFLGCTALMSPRRAKVRLGDVAGEDNDPPRDRACHFPPVHFRKPALQMTKVACCETRCRNSVVRPRKSAGAAPRPCLWIRKVCGKKTGCVCAHLRFALRKKHQNILHKSRAMAPEPHSRSLTESCQAQSLGWLGSSPFFYQGFSA